MPIESMTSPRKYLGITISSTFLDLNDHRTALAKAIKAHGLTEVAMENDSAKLVDVIDSSLQMVRDGAAYVGIIGKKYGQIPEGPRRNPNRLSITELELNEALRLSRPILLFIMGKDHLVREDDIETDNDKREKLKAFTERAKRMGGDSTVQRVYATFNSLEEFKESINPPIADLVLKLNYYPIIGENLGFAQDPIPVAPAFYAEPPYIGSHSFIGRASQLEVLNEWASPADSHPLFLYEAIGGSGKSMLTWEWATKYAPFERDDWAGRFWYSFYERGATMNDFCRRALTYMTNRRSAYQEKNTAELMGLLIHQLRDRPWLFILDGLERVLVSYHRFDAAQVRDEQAGSMDAIASRDPCAAANPEDEDLLRALTAATPSKILITSRLVPRALTNRSGQPIPGVLRERLPGLRPHDAELLIRSCGVTGTSGNIQRYLKTHCDCHPLVVGVLAGLVIDYLPAQGDFDVWADDPSGGGMLNLANLDLIHKRNHILNAALSASPEPGRRLLATLALLSEAVDFPTLSALNPELPPIPEAVAMPTPPEQLPNWNRTPIHERERAMSEYLAACELRFGFEQALLQRQRGLETAGLKLTETVRDLERRGLLQYDPRSKRFDLHPVVRGFAAGGLKNEERIRYGKLVVDHFSQQATTHTRMPKSWLISIIQNGSLRPCFKWGRKRKRETLSGKIDL